jgi:hypothetical protein
MLPVLTGGFVNLKEKVAIKSSFIFKDFKIKLNF